MKILLILATQLEAEHIIQRFKVIKHHNQNFVTYKYKNIEIDILISGVGIVNTTFFLTKTLTHHQHQYNACINLGIAGSFNEHIKIGDVLEVQSDLFADIGIENRDELLTLAEANLSDENSMYHSTFELPIKLPKVTAITVAKGSGSIKTINLLKSKYHADIESMEGAACYFVTKKLDVPCTQIRAISNYVEPRDINKWKIELALENLSKICIKQLDSLIL